MHQVIDLTTCPVKYTTQDTRSVLHVPEHTPDVQQEFLEWFAEQAGRGNSPAPQLKFPALLTKTQRAAVHTRAQCLGLHSESQGVGNNRHLVVQRMQACVCTGCFACVL